MILAVQTPVGIIRQPLAFPNFGSFPSGLYFLQIGGKQATDDGLVSSGVDQSGDIVAIDKNVKVATSSCVAV